jgi:hypothetical protein
MREPNRPGLARTAPRAAKGGRHRGVLPGALVALAVSITACSREDSSPAADLLRYVPADTPYAFVTSRPLPAPLRRRLGDHYAAQLGTQRSALSELRAELAGAPDAAAPEIDAMLDVADALLFEFEGRTTASELRELGVEPVPRSVLYGLGPLPAVRIEIADADRLDAMLDRVEARAGITAQRAIRDGRAYRRYELGAVDAVIAIAPGAPGTPAHLVAGLLPEPLLDAWLPLLLGLAPPPSSLAADGAIERLIERHGFTGFGEGFINLDALVALLTGGQGSGLEVARALGAGDVRLSGECRDLTADLVASMPRMVLGVTAAEDDRLAVRGIWESSATVAGYLQRLAAPVPGLGSPTDGLFALGLGIELPQLRNAIDALLRHLVDTGRNCDWVDPDRIRAARPRLNLALGPMTAGIKGFNLRVEDLQLDPATLQPTDVRAGLLAAVDDPRGVLALGALLDPALASLDVPADGSLVALPRTPGMPAAAPPLQVAIRDRALLLLAGTDAARIASPLLDAAPSNPAPLLVADYGVQRIVQRFGDPIDRAAERMDARGETDLAADTRRRLASFRAQAALFERLRLSLYANEQGLVVEQVMELR